jgi:hypothetical protein
VSREIKEDTDKLFLVFYCKFNYFLKENDIVITEISEYLGISHISAGADFFSFGKKRT